jgi:hypothetical protein
MASVSDASILELRAESTGGDSGGLLLLTDGTVGGVVRRARTDDEVCYALPWTDVGMRLSAIGRTEERRRAPVSTDEIAPTTTTRDPMTVPPAADAAAISTRSPTGVGASLAAIRSMRLRSATAATSRRWRTTTRPRSRVVAGTLIQSVTVPMVALVPSTVT